MSLTQKLDKLSEILQSPTSLLSAQKILYSIYGKKDNTRIYEDFIKKLPKDTAQHYTKFARSHKDSEYANKLIKQKHEAYLEERKKSAPATGKKLEKLFKFRSGKMPVSYTTLDKIELCCLKGSKELDLLLLKKKYKSSKFGIKPYRKEYKADPNIQPYLLMRRADALLGNAVDESRQIHTIQNSFDQITSTFDCQSDVNDQVVSELNMYYLYGGKPKHMPCSPPMSAHARYRSPICEVTKTLRLSPKAKTLRNLIRQGIAENEKSLFKIRSNLRTSSGSRRNSQFSRNDFMVRRISSDYGFQLCSQASATAFRKVLNANGLLVQKPCKTAVPLQKRRGKAID